jgi:hypothetical protein
MNRKRAKATKDVQAAIAKIRKSIADAERDDKPFARDDLVQRVKMLMNEAETTLIQTALERKKEPR